MTILLIAETSQRVMAGLVPAIHVLSCGQDVDARHKHAAGPAEGRTQLVGHNESVLGA